VGCGELQQWAVPTVVQIGIESEKFKIPTPNRGKLFQFTPSVSGIHNITTISIPERVDQGWAILDENGDEIQRCDFDTPERGRESADTNLPLKKGETVNLIVINFTGDEPNEPAEEVEFTITITPPKVRK